MRNRHSAVLSIAASAALLALAGGASAQTSATATTDLNMRAGPGPQFPVTGVINAGGAVTISGCMEGSKWCTVVHNGAEGWAYSDYLAADLSGSQVVVTQGRADLGLPVVTYEADAAEAGGAAGVTTGAAGGAIAGALIGGPIGAAIGGVAGAAAGGIGGAAIGAAVEPTPDALTFVRSNPVEPVYLEGEVVVGAGIPEPVALTPIPDYQYGYAYINGVPVVVDPGTRQIVYVVR
jgi:uncharacterized protein YraI